MVTTRFPCSMTGGFALEIFDRRNATEYEVGDIVMLDAEVDPVPGDMVFAAVDVEKGQSLQSTCLVGNASY